MSERIEVKVPDVGDFADIPVIEVLVSAGDRVDAEQSLITLESDKATMEVPSPVAGLVSEMCVGLDDTVSEGDIVAVIEAVKSASPARHTKDADTKVARESGTGDDATAPVAKSREPEVAAAPTESRPPDTQSPPVPMDAHATLPGIVPYASPAIRRFARELGVDLTRVSGSGKGGRIVRQDVTTFVKSALSATPPAASGGLGFDLPPPPKVNFARHGEVETRPLSRIQKISGAHLHRNWVGIPHVTQHDLADITDMEAFRKANAASALEQGFKLTPLVFLIKASVAALKAFPTFNASLDEGRENLVLKNYFHIGVAVDTPDGLVVPVLRDCEQKDMMQLASELAAISQTAREGKLKPTDLQGGCFTISSLGGIGGTSFTPIINAPEVAILGVSRSVLQPRWDGESFQPRMMLPLSLSYDHRVIDGASAARFARFLADRLERFHELEL